MPIIAFANPKGGSGKTTSALLLATELAEKGARVTLLDADPEKWISQWASLPAKPENISVLSDVSEETIVDQIDEAAQSSQFVVVDLEGTASLMVANAIGMADLVIIPTQGSFMDAKGAAKTLRLIKNQERMSRRKIPFAVLLSRGNAAITSRSLKNIQNQLLEGNIPVFSVAIIERAAFRDLFDYGGTLSALDPTKVSNLEKAIDNARAFVGEVLTRLKEGQLSDAMQNEKRIAK